VDSSTTTDKETVQPVVWRTIGASEEWHIVRKAPIMNVKRTDSQVWRFLEDSVKEKLVVSNAEPTTGKWLRSTVSWGLHPSERDMSIFRDVGNNKLIRLEFVQELTKGLSSMQ
jgi:hypothetical protein